MSVVTEITRIQTDRNTIRAKLVELGMAQNTDGLDKLAAAVEGIENRGAVSAAVQEGDTYTIPKGYHNGGGTVSGVPGGGKEWQLLIDETLTEDRTINTGSLPDVTEMLLLYAAPATDPTISSKVGTKSFGASIYNVSLTNVNYPTVGMIYGIKVGQSAIAFHRFYQSNTQSLNATRRVETNVQCAQTADSTNIPLQTVALPTGTIIRVCVR